MTRVIIAAVALALVPALALAKPAKQRRHIKQPQQQIACTVIGCVPVPRGCWQREGRTWSGMPTGGDVIVCPPGVAPFR